MTEAVSTFSGNLGKETPVQKCSKLLITLSDCVRS